MRILTTIALLLAGVVSPAQQTRIEPRVKPSEMGLNEKSPGGNTQPSPEQSRSQAPSDYVLGSGDQIIVRAMDVDEINDKPILIDMSGFVRLPVVGRIKVGGLTIAQLETELAQRLNRYVKKPDVSVSVAEFHSQPVSVIGSVRTPGIQQVQGRKTLVEMLSLAGGLDATAGNSLRITRRLEWGQIPLAGAVNDPSGQYSIAEVSLKSILEARNPEQNILVKPNDVISVPRAETVYVVGQVQKAGGFVLNDREQVTVLQALSMAGGLDKSAKPQNAKLLRRPPEGTSRTEIAVDLRKILDGKTSDVPMQPDDILFVPSSTAQKAGLRALEAAVQIGTGIVIWRRP
jgi:polysaccharide export outer membrane protein